MEERRLKARQEREQAERQAEAERAQEAAAEQARNEEAAWKRANTRLEREAAERLAEQEAAAQQAQEEAERIALQTAETMARSATAVPTNVLHIAKTATTNAQQVGAGIQGVTDTFLDAAKSIVPDLRSATSLPTVAVSALTEMQAAWIKWIGQTTRAGTRLSQELVLGS